MVEGKRGDAQGTVLEMFDKIVLQVLCHVPNTRVARSGYTLSSRDTLSILFAVRSKCFRLRNNVGTFCSKCVKKLKDKSAHSRDLLDFEALLASCKD